jgi:hypothetical protein
VEVAGVPLDNEGNLALIDKSNGTVKDKTYRTKFGPSVYHTGRIYEDSANSLKKALTRLTNKREPYTLGGVSGGFEYDVEATLIHNQFVYARSQKRHKILLYFRSIFTKMDIQQLHDNLHEFVTRPHPKRKLREDAYKYLCENGLLGDPESWCNSVLGKVKRDEYAKPGKYTRLVNDLGVAASLVGSELTEQMKSAIAKEDFIYKNSRATFVKSPSFDQLCVVFNRLINPEYEYEMVYHSDDSCVAVRATGKVYNMDISTCDVSARSPVFDILSDGLGVGYGRELMGVLIRQCQKKLTLVNPHDPRDKTVLKPTSPVEYSGSTLTTLLNNVDNLFIFTCIVDAHASSADEMVAAAYSCGFLVTLEECTHVSKIQFLKYSPCETDNGYAPFLNLGVILRAIGTCRGDLPGRRREGLVYRANAFMGNLVNGMANGASTSTLKALQRRFPMISDKHNTSETTRFYAVERSSVDCEDRFILERYGITQYELDELNSCLSSSGFGDQIHCDASAAMLKIDYGL